MKLRFFILLAIITVFGVFSAATAQVDSVLGQFTNSNAESFAGGISGNGRFVVFESRGNLATENPRNADNNREIFLFDYAQRRIFQITDTKVLLKNIATAPTFDNVRVEIANVRPVISNDGRWIAFGSNATIAFPGTATLPPIISETNPGNFDANFFTVRTTNPTAETNSLTQDGNLEIWLYQVPAVAPADLTTGEELPVTDLSAGSFTRVTNTPPSVLPAAASTTSGAFIADDNHDASISNDGNVTAFVSTRNLDLVVGNASPQNNDEIFTYVRSANQISQVTNTPRGAVANPIYSVAPSISGNGTRVAFSGNGVNPIVGMTGGSNADLNEEIFYTDLNASGAPTGTRRQITTTTQTNPGDIVNVWDFGRRMSLDGRYIAFDSYAELEPAGSGASQSAFALYLYDTAAATNPFRRIGPKSDADSAAGGGDVAHYPGFTDYSISGVPATLVFSTRLNIKADGTVPATQADGLNPDVTRPVQIYSYPLNQPAATATFTRLTKFPAPNSFLASTQAIPSDSVQRITFNLALTEPGTGNPDLLSEVFYLLQPVAVSQTTLASLNLATGASRIPVSASPVPTPSPTATPSPTPTPSPSATPIPTPTPQTPSAVQGLSPGMLAVVNFDPALSPAIVARTAVGSLSRSFTLPIQLSGVTLTVNGVAAGLKSVSSTQIEFVVPPALAGSAAGTAYPVVINNNGTVIKGTTAIPLNIILVPARPDVFTNLPVPGPGGRARVFNATNTVLTTEPFTVTTVRRRGGRRVPTVLRLHLTGVQGLPAAAFTIRIGSTTITGAQITSGAVLFAPGVYTVDFTLPPELNRAGDQPIIVSVTVGGVTYFARLDDTAPRLFIL